MTGLEETFVALVRLNDLVHDKEKRGILLSSLPEEFSFLAITGDTQNIDYDSIWAILKPDAERKKSM